MRKMLFLMLSLMFLGTVCTNAQVTIGDNSAPHPGAVLDLKTSTKGLKLPRVDLLDVNVFQLSTDQVAEAAGMIVYNTSNATVGGQGKGVYVWDGAKWLFAAISGGPAIVPVESVTVSAWDNTYPTSLNSGSTLQLKATVLPAEVVNKSVTWSIVDGDAATVNSSGLVTSDGTGAGAVVIRATSVADERKWGDYTLKILGPGTVTGNRDTYTTWCFAGTPGDICWMTQNSTEGDYSSAGEGQHTGRGYYYTLDQATANANTNACPSGWSLPTRPQARAMQTYWNGTSDPPFETAWRANGFGGWYNPATSTVVFWDVYNMWWIDNYADHRFSDYQLGMSAPLSGDDGYWHAVRCVKPN